jgi:hypothetical protein
LSERGFEEAELLCTAGNSRARNFYEREGWVLERLFDDALWLPKDAPGRLTVETACYRKSLNPA